MPPTSSPDVLTDLTASPPPKGFLVTASRDGYPAVEYRTQGMIAIAWFFAVWLAIWTPGCILMTYQAFFGKNSPEYTLMLFSLPFWAGEFGVIGYVLWLFCSVTTFTFYADRLRVERSLFNRYRRTREIPRREISVVRQVKDGGEGEDSFPSWGLAVEGEANFKLLSRQKIEKSAWLGPIVARWAGVEYEPSRKKQYDEI